jgi:hypothetical protein
LQEGIGMEFISGIETDNIANPAPYYIKPGQIGEQLPVNTTISIMLVKEYQVKLSKVGIANKNSNIEIVSARYFDGEGKPILRNNEPFVSWSVPGQQPIIYLNMPAEPVSRVDLKIEKLSNAALPALVTLTMVGCYQRSMFLYMFFVLFFIFIDASTRLKRDFVFY